jgi:hypothetical protein
MGRPTGRFGVDSRLQTEAGLRALAKFVLQQVAMMDDHPFHHRQNRADISGRTPHRFLEAAALP